MSKKDWPQNAHRKITLCTGRVLFLRKPTFKDFRLAAQASKVAGQETRDEIKFFEEQFIMVLLELRRKNGEKVDFTTRDKFFDEILTDEEAFQLVQNPQITGLTDEKKNPPVVELLQE